MSGSVGRNLGLVVALLLLVIVGAVTAGETFTSVSNLLTILRQASIIGVISIGMTLVIIAGGIDLSVGSVMGLASVVATLAVDPGPSPTRRTGSSWWSSRSRSASLAGLINGVVIAYGKVVAVHGDPRDARRRPRTRRDPRRTPTLQIGRSARIHRVHERSTSSASTCSSGSS